MKYGIKDGRKMKKQHPKCGREFSPAGYATHVKHCAGPDYKPNHTHSERGGHNKEARSKLPPKAKKEPIMLECRKGCGRMCVAQGRPHHEKYCKGPGYVPGYSAKRRIERRMTASPPLKLKAKEPEPYYTAYYAPSTIVKWAYEKFPEDSALFSAMCHIASCTVETSAEEQIKHLIQARDMLSLKILNLQG